MNLLITGGLGFVGTNLVARLLDRADVAIRVLDSGETGAPQPPLRDQRVTIQIGNVLDRSAVARAVDGVDAVVHLAAATGVVQSLEDPRQTLKVNVDGTVNLLEACRARGVRRFVLASSNAAVGEHEPPLDERTPPRPVSPYGASKLAGEALCSAYAAAYGLETAALRFSNVYGPYSVHKGSVVASFFRAALAGRELEVTGDGSQTRDFVFTGDLTRAICLALECAPAGSVFQIASGSETSIDDLAGEIRQLVAATTGIQSTIRYVAAREGDVHRNYSAIARAAERLGYAPGVELADGLRQTLQWFVQTGHVGTAVAG